MLNSLFSQTGQIAVVTGALGKLGTTWCMALLEAGACVAALDLPTAPANPDFLSLQNNPQFAEQLAIFPVDVTDQASLEEALVRIAQHWPRNRLSVLVNNAGIDQPPTSSGDSDAAKYSNLFELPATVLSRIWGVNTLGAFQCMQVFGKPMVQQGYGSIINIGSLYASVSPDAQFYTGLPKASPADPDFLKPPGYGASKAALINLTRYFATHWGASGVRVNAMSPGGVAGGQHASFVERFCARVPLGRMAQPEDLTAPLLFLAGDGSRYVTGTELLIDGGFTVW